MRTAKNIVQLQAAREIHPRYDHVIQERFHATSEFIDRLGLYAELDHHSGCVNCLEWSSDGRQLAQHLWDDTQVCVWEPYRKKHLIAMQTGHHGNVFTVKFLPNSENRALVTGAADFSVRVHDILAKEIMRVCTCHTNRVKRVVVDPNIPYLYWSAGEDGMIIQHDMRENHVCSTESKRPKNVMVDLRNYLGNKAEAKCLAIDPVRPDFFAVGANDPYVRIYDRRMIKLSEEGRKAEIPFGAVQYFVPGHLPPKIGEYKRKYRSLASTYVSYSPDGNELLVNLGGEQIYLFPVHGDLQKGVTCLTIPEGILKHPSKHQNGCTNGYKNGSALHNGVGDNVPHMKPLNKVVLPPIVEAIKSKANEAFGIKKYAKAVHHYNEALKMYPESAILHANRAAALVKRNWDGDIYGALKDCQIALKLDPDHYKAHMRYKLSSKYKKETLFEMNIYIFLHVFRMCRCLFELKRYNETQECLNVFKLRFPSCVREAVSSLENDLIKASTASDSKDNKGSESGGSTSSASSSSASSSSSSRSAGPRTRRNFLIRFQRSSSERSNSNDETTDASPTREDNQQTISVEETDSRSSTETSSGENQPAVIESSSSESSNRSQSKRPPILLEYEKEYENQAVDYKQRFCGHCNTTTDIKEATFFGNFVVAGSDDGSFYIFDRETTNIVKIMKGDESIVNCLQPHPSSCCLATSGIESVVRIWMPLSEGQANDRVVEDVTDAAYANQRRMNSNPFEVILMNMGYRMNGDEEPSDEESAQEAVPMQCNPT
ncbi:WD and tetratricopeptide repeats protein 1 [Orchesella cincta]|uniref:WD and tetratricopeptide repeats protein 1 n=1 Tax=Orchesella cincta TaxID=48709 RepID=A0A1D2MSS8_ORCCI|nr:WD and tetratricopeptide repeats protein 1 [Orchesella cincta]